MVGPYMQCEIINGRTSYVMCGYQQSDPICNVRLSMVGPYQKWALPQIGPQIRKLRTQVSICGFANLISYCKYLRICGEKLKSAANPQSNRQYCLIRGETAWKKWTLLFSGLEVTSGR